MKIGEKDMEFKKLNKKIINSWRVARLIRLIIFLSIALFDTFIWDMDGTVWTIVFYGLWAITAYCLISFIVYPPLEYRQWGYYIDDEKVVIKNGLFFISQTTIPVIRIQNITVSQGLINRAMELYTVEMSLASGSFEIVGLDKATADSINEGLRAKLYHRIEEKGVL